MFLIKILLKHQTICHKVTKQTETFDSATSRYRLASSLAKAEERKRLKFISFGDCEFTTRLVQGCFSQLISEERGKSEALGKRKTY